MITLKRKKKSQINNLSPHFNNLEKSKNKPKANRIKEKENKEHKLLRWETENKKCYFEKINEIAKSQNKTKKIAKYLARLIRKRKNKRYKLPTREGTSPKSLQILKRQRNIMKTLLPINLTI